MVGCGARPSSLTCRTSRLNQMISSSCKTTIPSHLGSKVQTSGSQRGSTRPRDPGGSLPAQSSDRTVQGLGRPRCLLHFGGPGWLRAPPRAAVHKAGSESRRRGAMVAVSVSENTCRQTVEGVWLDSGRRRQAGLGSGLLRWKQR